MLGASLAQSACCRPKRAVPGRLVGISPRFGHHLRDGKAFEKPHSKRSLPLVVIGAGPSGLSAAWRLNGLGEERFEVLELEARAGGSSTYGEKGAFPHPWGAHYLPLPGPSNQPLLRLLAEMGEVQWKPGMARPIPKESSMVRLPEERLFVDGAWQPGLYPRRRAKPADLRELTRFRIKVAQLAKLTDGKGRRPFQLPMATGSDDPRFRALDKQSMTQWLAKKGFKSHLLHWWVDYACRDDYGLRAQDTSAWAGLFYFAARLEEKNAHSAHFLSWPEGNGHLVKHLSKGLEPGQLRTGQMVIRMANRQGAVDLWVLDTATQKVNQITAERVIFAAQKFLLPYVMPEAKTSKHHHSRDFQYGAWVVANLHVKARPRGYGTAMAWDNVLYDSPSLGYVDAGHQAHTDEGPTVLTYYYPYTDRTSAAGRKKLLQAGFGDLSDMAMSELSPAHLDLHEQVQKMEIMRYGHAMIQPRTGFLWHANREAAAKPLGRVHFAHSDLSGLALFEEAFYRGIKAAEEVYGKSHTSGWERWT